MPGRTTIIIPARFASSRFPGKPLALLRGASGARVSLIERSWRTATAIAASLPGVQRVIVATDDDRIAEAARGFGAEVAMTPASCRNGTERCAAALATLDDTPDIVVNLQGDAPLTPPDLVEATLARMGQDPDLPMCTPVVPCSPTMLRSLIDDQKAGRVGGTTAVFTRTHDALYFSKRVLPYLPETAVEPGVDGTSPPLVHLHLGVYAYRPSALAAYVGQQPGVLENVEGLEQLRFLDAGIRVGVAVCPPPAWDVIELNNPTDIPAIEAVLAARGMN